MCTRLPQVSEGSRCVAVQMHNLQHKFLQFSLSEEKKQHAPSIGMNTRISLFQAALFYHHREAADRRDKISRLIKLALVDLKDAAEIEKLSRSLHASHVDLDCQAAKHEGGSLAPPQNVNLTTTPTLSTPLIMANLCSPCAQR